MKKLKNGMHTKNALTKNVDKEVNKALKRYRDAHKKALQVKKDIAALRKRIFKQGHRIRVPSTVHVHGKEKKTFKSTKLSDIVKKSILISKALNKSRFNDIKSSEYREHLHRIALDIAKKRLGKRAFKKMKKNLERNLKKKIKQMTNKKVNMPSSKK